jgi:hypothetical protein
MRGTQPAAEVTLYYAGQATSAVGIFDSGSVHTVFSPECAALIGIDDVTTGNREEIGTLGGPVDIYLFDLEIQLRIVGARFGAQVGFFAGHAARNILGRSVFFAAFEIGFHERAGLVHICPEE